MGNNRTFGGFQYFIMTMFNFDRHQDMSLMDNTWSEHTGVKSVGFQDAWYLAFDGFRKARIIPDFGQ